MDALVSTDWLERELGASDLRVVDATKFSADAGRDARADYETGHIPGAVFMDLAELVDASSAIDNMAPPAEKFASRMQSLGLGDGSRIVIYDDSPLKSAARAWWLLKLFGAHDVALTRDPDDGVAVGDDDRPDAVLGQEPHELSHGLVSARGDHRGALAADDVVDAHAQRYP